MNCEAALVGLGNPGPRYANTRHNCGFLVVDALVALAHDEGDAVQLNGGKFSCELWRLRLPWLGGWWLAAKPQTFMNLSGQCVQPLLSWHKMTPDRLVVAHDELDIPAGELRFKFGGGNAGHNGLKSITELLGTPDFHRLRVGIGRPLRKEDVTGWVLGRPAGEDADLIRQATRHALGVLRAFAAHGPAEASREAKAMSAKATA